MRLDAKTLARLTVSVQLNEYYRATPLLHAGTPLGMGYGSNRFSSPSKSFKELYLAQDLATSIAEAIIRDRFVGLKRANRRISVDEAASWGLTRVSSQPLRLIDLRTTGALLLGVATNTVRGRAHAQSQKVSQAIHSTTDADGILYASRITNDICVAVYERAVTTKLQASPVESLTTFPAFISTLSNLGITLV